MIDLSEGTVFIDSESGHLLGAPVVASVLALVGSGAAEMPG